MEFQRCNNGNSSLRAGIQGQAGWTNNVSAPSAGNQRKGILKSGGLERIDTVICVESEDRIRDHLLFAASVAGISAVVA